MTLTERSSSSRSIASGSCSTRSCSARHRRQPLRLDPLPQPPPERRVRVDAEVEAVVPEDALEQQLDLDALEIGR